MARVFSQALIRESHSLVRDLTPSSHRLFSVKPGGLVRPLPWRLVGVRLNSDRPEVGQLIEFDLSQVSDTANVEVLCMRRLEDAIQILVVQKSAPAWIPFVPGSSYWVPPRPRGFGLGIVSRSEKSLTEEEALSRTTQRGWPSSSYFMDGGRLTVTAGGQWAGGDRGFWTARKVISMGVMPDHHSTKIFSMAAAQSDEEE